MSDFLEEFMTGTGQRLRVHRREDCQPPCAVHAPSWHPLMDAPLLWRPDRRILERLCTHGIGHPDPDDLEFGRANGSTDSGIHGCDGCCHVGVTMPLKHEPVLEKRRQGKLR